MTPQLQQAIRLLQLSAVDLQSEIQTALDSNPLLELDENPPPPLFELKYNTFEREQSTCHTLQDHLCEQLQHLHLSEIQSFIALIIIDAINKDGFLDCSLDEIVSTAREVIDIDKSQVETILHTIQQLEPAGIAARNLSECLKIQLEMRPELPWRNKALILVHHHLALLGKRDYATLKRRLGLSCAELHAVIQCIQSLNPRPGSAISANITEYVTPDVYAYKNNGQWQVELNSACNPPLQIHQYYASLIRHRDASRDNQFLRHQLQEARWFLKSIATRNQTLLKVTQTLVQHQKRFLEHGEAAMKPLLLQQVAEQLNLHESTISRITTQKYLHTPRGTFELKYFLSRGLSAGTAIRASIKKLIATECPRNPLSDIQLVKLLAQQGIHIARRTVTKHREAMTISPSNKRKQLV